MALLPACLVLEGFQNGWESAEFSVHGRLISHSRHHRTGMAIIGRVFRHAILPQVNFPLVIIIRFSFFMLLL